MAASFTGHTDNLIAWIADQLAIHDLTLILCNQSLTAKQVATVDISTNSITTTASHGFVLNDEIVLSANGGAGVTPTPIEANRPYFVAGTITTTSFQLAAYPGGPAIDLTAAGSGTIYAKKLAWGRNVSITEVVATEVPNTNNYARKSIALGATTQSEIYQAYSVPSPTVVSASGGSIIYDSYAFILGGSTTYGSTTGQVVYGFVIEDSSITIDPAVPRAFPLDTRLANADYATGVAE
jgi:hypothetical protein